MTWSLLLMHLFRCQALFTQHFKTCFVFSNKRRSIALKNHQVLDNVTNVSPIGGVWIPSWITSRRCMTTRLKQKCWNLTLKMIRSQKLCLTLVHLPFLYRMIIRISSWERKMLLTSMLDWLPRMGTIHQHLHVLLLCMIFSWVRMVKLRHKNVGSRCNKWHLQDWVSDFFSRDK